VNGGMEGASTPKVIGTDWKSRRVSERAKLRRPYFNRFELMRMI
jgi:hypothetical protein